MNSGAAGFSGGDLFDHLDLDRLTLNEMLNDSFISKNTNFGSAEEMVQKCGFRVSSLADFNSVPIDKIDEFVKNSSRFGSWRELLDQATKALSGSAEEDQFN